MDAFADGAVGGSFEKFRDSEKIQKGDRGDEKREMIDMPIALCLNAVRLTDKEMPMVRNRNAVS